MGRQRFPPILFALLCHADQASAVAGQFSDLAAREAGLAGRCLLPTGPIICVTSGLCVPGASWRAVGSIVLLVCFARFPWANSATAMPSRQNAEAIKMRRLKKADFEVDFFFIDGAELFPSAVNPKR